MPDKLLSILEQYKLPLALSLLGLVLIIGGIFTSSAGRQDFPKESLVKGEKLISVDVSGAVKNPGVYQLKEGERTEEAINASGGFAENANQEYISKHLNLAQKLLDGTKVYVPAEGETTAGVVTQAGGGVVAGVQSKVNINTATQGEIEALPGIGPVTASKVISTRPYGSVEELLSKKVVGKAVFEKIKDLVVVY